MMAQFGTGTRPPAAFALGGAGDSGSATFRDPPIGRSTGDRHRIGFNHAPRFHSPPEGADAATDRRVLALPIGRGPVDGTMAQFGTGTRPPAAYAFGGAGDSGSATFRDPPVGRSTGDRHRIGFNHALRFHSPPEGADTPTDRRVFALPIGRGPVDGTMAQFGTGTRPPAAYVFGGAGDSGSATFRDPPVGRSTGDRRRTDLRVSTVARGSIPHRKARTRRPIAAS